VVVPLEPILSIKDIRNILNYVWYYLRYRGWVIMLMNSDLILNADYVKISEAAQKTCEAMSSVDYLESNFRAMLARELRKSYDVYEEVVVPYILNVDPIPIGHGYVDIVVMTAAGAIILELKITKKDCTRQLQKYMKHWTYCRVKGGATINFVNDQVSTCFYDLLKVKGGPV